MTDRASRILAAIEQIRASAPDAATERAAIVNYLRDEIAAIERTVRGETHLVDD